MENTKQAMEEMMQAHDFFIAKISYHIEVEKALILKCQNRLEVLETTKDQAEATMDLMLDVMNENLN